MKKRETEKKILSNLETGYDSIADKFSNTRAFMWRDLGFMKNLVESDGYILDFGCGNGRLAGFFEGNYGKYVGTDISQKLLNIARQRYSSEKTEFIKVNPMFERLPFGDGYFDTVFSIAVFHHFPSREYALQVSKELYRISKPGGKIVISVWNLWQKQYLKYHQKTNKEWMDANIPFKSGERIFNRYHHPFKIGEFEGLFREAGFKTMEKKEGWNLLYIGKK
ncbi:MAG: class I SAM-dependent methyltransferase [Parcubacteria group bacterium]|jgi:ubiquinone/menaquinone biosynthesis C-methylase UbiE